MQDRLKEIFNPYSVSTPPSFIIPQSVPSSAILEVVERGHPVARLERIPHWLLRRPVGTAGAQGKREGFESNEGWSGEGGEAVPELPFAERESPQSLFLAETERGVREQGGSIGKKE